MGKRKFTKKGLVMMSALYFLSLSTVGVGAYALFTSNTFAWWASNTTVEVGGLSISVAKEKKADITFSAYRYDLDANKGKKMDENAEDFLLMNPYESVFTTFNQYNPMYLRLHLKDGDYAANESFQLTVTHDKSKDGDSSSATADGLATTSSTLSDCISSVVSLQAAVYTFDDSNLTEDKVEDKVYDTINQYFENGDGKSAETVSFVSFDETSKIYTKLETVTFSSLTHPGTAECDVWIRLNYNDDLALKYADQKLGSSTGIAIGDDYSLGNDLTQIKMISQGA